MVCWRGWIYSVCQEKEKNLLVGVAEPQAEEDWGEQQREILVVIPPSLIYLLTDIKSKFLSFYLCINIFFGLWQIQASF